MKKFIIFLVIIILIVVAFSYFYLNFKSSSEIERMQNAVYESYYDKECLGTDVTTVINKAIDSNKSNEVSKNEKKEYINNENNSINIDIKFTDNDKIYNMETIYNNGTSSFVAYYGEIKFKCTKIEHHQSTNRVKYMMFEQISQ